MISIWFQYYLTQKTINMSVEKILNNLSNALDKMVNSININGEKFTVEGRNIVVRNGTVIVDGKVIKDKLKGDVKITFEGDLANLDCASAIINGNVKGNVDGTTITVNGNVQGNVDGTTIKCGDVQGDVDGTTVHCGNVQGDVDAVTVNKR